MFGFKKKRISIDVCVFMYDLGIHGGYFGWKESLSLLIAYRDGDQEKPCLIIPLNGSTWKKIQKWYESFFFLTDIWLKKNIFRCVVKCRKNHSNEEKKMHYFLYVAARRALTNRRACLGSYANDLVHCRAGSIIKARVNTLIFRTNLILWEPERRICTN